MKCPHCPISETCKGESLPRFCQLVDPDHAAFNPAYRDLLAPVAADVDDDDRTEEPAESTRLSLAEMLRLTALARKCLFRSKPSCSCEGAAACALKQGQDVSAQTCWNCVRRYGG